MDSISVSLNKTDKSIRVEKIENGYIITKSISRETKEDGYTHEEKKYFSKTNPLEDMDISLADKFDID